MCVCFFERKIIHDFFLSGSPTKIYAYDSGRTAVMIIPRFVAAAAAAAAVAAKLRYFKAVLAEKYDSCVPRSYNVKNR